jgi:anti-sigma B factor antagonist
MTMTSNERESGDVTIVDLHGRVALGEESAALRDKIAALLTAGKKKILLNLKDVSYMDSSGLGALVSAFTSAKKQGVEIKLTELSPKVTDLMEITRLYTVFDVSDNEAAALASFAKSTTAAKA